MLDVRCSHVSRSVWLEDEAVLAVEVREVIVGDGAVLTCCGGKDEAVRGRGGPWMPTCRGRRLVGPRIFGDLPIFRWIVVVVGRRAGGILRF